MSKSLWVDRSGNSFPTPTRVPKAPLIMHLFVKDFLGYLSVMNMQVAKDISVEMAKCNPADTGVF
jgi:hypothetical protein